MSFGWSSRRTLVLGALAATVWVSPAGAQQGEIWDGNASRVTRPALEELRTRYERAAESPAYSEVLRSEAREQADLVGQRLEQGDFRVGDRVSVYVEDNVEITDTLAVTADATIILAGVGEVPLRGVLRSELEGKVTEAVATAIRDPQVRTRSLVRISLDGAVGAPGYYLVDADEPLSDVLMRAGGYTQQAKLDRARIERGGVVIVSADRFEDALREGATVDHLGLRDGDRIYLPASRGSMLTYARDFLFLIPTAIGLLTLL